MIEGLFQTPHVAYLHLLRVVARLVDMFVFAIDVLIEVELGERITEILCVV